MFLVFEYRLWYLTRFLGVIFGGWSFLLFPSVCLLYLLIPDGPCCFLVSLVFSCAFLSLMFVCFIYCSTVFLVFVYLFMSSLCFRGVFHGILMLLCSLETLGVPHDHSFGFPIITKVILVFRVPHFLPSFQLRLIVFLLSFGIYKCSPSKTLMLPSTPCVS
jgi:hypothetical protein